jgi:hypothetical protein
MVFKHESRFSSSEAHLVACSIVASEIGRHVWLLQPVSFVFRNIIIEQ